MQRYFILMIAIVAMVLLGGQRAAQAAWMLYGIDPSFDELHQIDPADGANITNVTITLAGETVLGGNGLATNPLTGELFAVLKLSGQTGRELVNLDPLTGIATSIGDTAEKIAGLTFDNSGTLYGVSGDGGVIMPETLFTISTTDASLTHFLDLGAGGSGEAIAFNPDDGMIYHASGGFGDKIFESIDIGTKNISPIPLSGDSYDELLAIVYDPMQGLFLGADLFASYLSVSESGVATILGGGGGTAFTAGVAAFEPLRGFAFFNVVPEPSTLILFATTATCLFGYGWRRKRKLAA